MNYLAKRQPLTLEQIAAEAPSALALTQHDSRSARYTYIPTLDIIKGMEREGWRVYDAKQSRTRDASRREYTKHLLRFRHDSGDQQKMTKVGDSIPEIVLVNSHDGTSAYKLIHGIFRLVCTNGMIVSDAELAAISIPHKGDIVAEVIRGSYELAQHSERIMQTIQGWAQLQLTAGEQTALAESARTLRFGDAEGKVDTPITAEQLLRPRRYEDSKPDLWHTFNRVQENTMKGGLSGLRRDKLNRPRHVRTREVKGIDQDVKLNRALWQLAERLAELKGDALEGEYLAS